MGLESTWMGDPPKEFQVLMVPPNIVCVKTVLPLFRPCGAITQKRLDLMPNFEPSQHTKIRALIFIKRWCRGENRKRECTKLILAGKNEEKRPE